VTSQDDRIVLGNTSHTNAYIKIDWTVTSDERDKTEIADVTHGLSFVKQMRPISYKFNTNREDSTPRGNTRYGFSAQDVLALEGDSPVITNNEDTDNLKMTSAYLVPVLVKALQELSAKNDALETRIAALENA
jgi:hypothetical protein